MKHGPRPKLPALRIVESGRKVRSRFVTRDNVQASPGEPIGPPPPHLNAEQQAAWTTLAAGAPSGTLAACDAPLFEGLVTLSCVQRQMVQTLNASADPETLALTVREIRRTSQLLRVLGSELLLTPSARLRSPPLPPNAPDPLAPFLAPA